MFATKKLFLALLGVSVASALATPIVAGDATKVKRDSLPSDYISTVLYNHNVHRANHSADALTYDSSLACKAKNAMGDCPAKPGDPGNFFGSVNSQANYGGAAELTASGILAWYNEGTTYASLSNNYRSDPAGGISNIDSWGHFSQMVWAANTKVGCWATECGPGTAYLNSWGSGFASGSAWMVGCAYSPGGNVEDSYVANVHSPLGQKPVDASNWKEGGNQTC